LFDAVCLANDVKCMSVLTGFKYIGEKIKEFEQSGDYSFIFGYEESYGYLPGTYARDKDAVATSLLIAEMAAYYKRQGKSLHSVLMEMYGKYGFYKELGISNVVKGIDPMNTMREKMTELRKDGLRTIADIAVLRVRDFKTKEITDLRDNSVSDTGLPAADVLYYELADGSTYIIRPSGTEPKIKVYVLAKGETMADVDAKLDAFEGFTKTLF